ncbi:NADH-quinone oxidoreductase subunit J [uncultured Acetobacteroides sp.]|jgi:NADH-quinone oxidoreductase subunit J|uniref:NADH-quinone oxidoreductase subunit J family protein n=1 Tax=uncultured Acetobacteroides sp. TaxID=1760811 RepID=UPI0029F45EAC|nr:NADH-quinone oxidoreductase subunit J [uncultured Acetobacteroides sp.]
MSAEIVIFYILALMAVAFGALTVFSRMIFRSAIYLLFCMVSIAGLYFLMSMEFIAGLQILIYVGGIIVLIIFSIFLTHKSGQKLPASKRSNLIWGGLLGVAGLALTLGVLFTHAFPQTSQVAVDASVKTIGIQMLDYTNHGYALFFEVISFLLLAALVGSIAIAIKDKKE